MTQFTVEEINLICIYNTGTRGALLEEITAAFSYMDGEFQELARRVVGKLERMTDDEFSGLALDPVEDGDG